MRSRWRFALTLLGAAWLAGTFAGRAHGQNPPAPDPSTPTVLVTGTVTDKDSGAPVPGARVFVESFYGGGRVVGGPTDAAGRFEVRSGTEQRFLVYAVASAYMTPAQREIVTLTDGQQSVNVDIKLARLGSVKGIVADADTGAPLGNTAVYAIAKYATQTVTATGGPSKPMPAQADGAFQIDDLTDAEFFLRIVAGPEATIETIPAGDLAGEGRDKALEAPEGAVGYGDIFWPGGTGDMPQSGSLRVTSGLLDVGVVRIERRKLHTITGVINGCDPGASLLLTFAPSSRRDKTLTHDLVCGEGFRILNYPEGSYMLSVVQGGPPRRFAFQAIDPATRGPLTLVANSTQTVQIDVSLEGVAPDDIPADLKNLRVEVTPENAPVRISSPAKTLEGTFEAELFSGLRYLLSLRVLPKYYLKKLNYNGADSSDVSGFTSYGGALHLIFSDHPGTLEVKLASPSMDFVFAVREGMSYASVVATGQDMARQLVNQMVRPTGAATLQGLAPGAYRVFLSPTFTPSERDYEELLRGAKSVQMEEGQTASVSLDAP